MTKQMRKTRTVLKSLGYKANVSISVAFSVPGFLNVEVEYEKTLTPPDNRTTVLLMKARVPARVLHS